MTYVTCSLPFSLEITLKAGLYAGPQAHTAQTLTQFQSQFDHPCPEATVTHLSEEAFKER